jgi:hypothetical protein
MSSGTPSGRFQDVIRTNLSFAENGRFREAGLYAAIYVRRPTTDIGPKGEGRHYRQPLWDDREGRKQP